jgi:hypothetical protein
MNYSILCSIFSWPRAYKREATGSSSAVQFTPAHDKKSRVRRTEVKIRLPGRAVQNTEIEDRLVYVLQSCEVNNCSSAKEGQINKALNKHSTNCCRVTGGTSDNMISEFAHTLQ